MEAADHWNLGLLLLLVILGGGCLITLLWISLALTLGGRRCLSGLGWLLGECLALALRRGCPRSLNSLWLLP